MGQSLIVEGWLRAVGRAKPVAEAACEASRHYLATPAGVALATPQGRDSLSRYAHDVLVLCASGVWIEDLRQFMPPRSLDQALKELQDAGLVAWREQQRPAVTAPAAAEASQARPPDAGGLAAA